jgi:cytochrome c oxidase subunit 2
MSRATIGSGVTTNSAANLHAWVRDPQTIKDGCYMPNMQLTDEELDQVAEYLASLK